jgi:hypothetical protein
MTSTVAAVGVRSRSGRLFYLGIGLAIIAAVVIGFSRSIGEGLLHPTSARPLTLHVHVALFTAWLLVFVAQAVLVGARKMRWHRRLGYGSIGLASAMVVSGVATTIVMTQLRAAEGGAFAMWLALHQPDWWLTLAHRMLAA